MKNVKRVLDEVLEEIKPDNGYEKKIFDKLNLIVDNINKSQKFAKAVLGGSGAKGTWLKTFDADIFVLFDYSKFKDKSDKLSDILESALKRKIKRMIRIHGSRDYFQIKEEVFTFEIVPILKIHKAEQAKNITDVSPLHSKWVLKHKKLAGEMRLAKQFCHAQNIYGAESYIRGFSGYICEVLAVYYGSFLNLMKNAAKWDDKEVIDVEKYYKGDDVFRLVNTSKLVSPLIVIDPVQKDRNAAAALSQKKFDVFKKTAGNFLKNPSKKFFVKMDLKSLFSGLKSGSNKLVMVKVAPLSGKVDVVGSKLLKIYEFIIRRLESKYFKIIEADWEWNKKDDAVFYFLFGKNQLSKYVEIKGPPLKIKQHVENFRRIHKKTFVKKGAIFAVEKREFTVPESLLKFIVKDKFVKERSNSIKIILT